MNTSNQHPANPGSGIKNRCSSVNSRLAANAPLEKALRLLAVVMLAGLVLQITVQAWYTSEPALNSDPSCYLNYGKALAGGSVYFDTVPSKMVFDHGGSFPESAFHGYMFANKDNRLYSFVGLGFPLVIAACIKVLGLSQTVLINLWLLPLFLVTYVWAIRAALPRDWKLGRSWLPVVALLVFYKVHMDHLGAWVLPYRELPSMIPAFLAFILASKEGKADRPPIGSTVLCGLLIGFSTCIRETSLLMALPIGLMLTYRWRHELTPLRFVMRGALLASIMFASWLLAYSPQLIVNNMHRGSLVGEQMDAATENLFEENYTEDGDIRDAGFTTRNLKRYLPERIDFIHGILGAGVFVAILGGLMSLSRRYFNFAMFGIASSTLYILLYSAFHQPPGAPRYELMIFLFLAPMLAFGLLRGAALLGRSLSDNLLGLLVGIPIVILCFAGVGSFVDVVKASSSQDRFSLASIQSFEKQFRDLPAGSLVLSEIPARDYVQYLTDADSASLSDVLQAGLSPKQMVDYCDENHIPLYFLYSKNFDLYSVPYDSLELMESLKGSAKLTPVKTMDPVASGLVNHFGVEQVVLYEASKLENSERRINLPCASWGDCRLELHFGAGAVVSNLQVTVEGEARTLTEVAGKRFLLELDVPQNQASLSLELKTAVPHPEPTVRLLPRDAALSIRVGTIGQDLPWLGHTWISGADPTYLNQCRTLPGSSSLRLESAVDWLGTKGNVMLSVFPGTFDQAIEWSQGGDSYRKAQVIKDHNGLVTGWMIPRVELGEELQIRRPFAKQPFIRWIHLGTSSSLTNSGESQAGFSGAWRVLHQSEGDSGFTESLVFGDGSSIRSPDGTGFSRSSAWLLAPMPEAAAIELAGVASQMEYTHLFWKGFFERERAGQWTREVAEWALPVFENKGEVEVVLGVQDHRPDHLNPEVRIEAGGQILLTTNLSAEASSHLLKCVVPPLDPPVVLRMISTPFVPADEIEGSRDTRALGVFVESLSLSRTAE